MRVLILASSPSDRPHLRLNQEVALIQQELEHSSYITYFHPAATPADFLHLLCTQEPDIVHVSAHGTEEELELENLFGRTHGVATDVLTRLFQECNVRIQCVLLNACQSEGLAEEISQHVDYVIGMSGKIWDSSAVEFTRGFYKALAQNRSIKSAFEIGRLSIAVGLHPEDQQFPVLKQRSPTLDSAPLTQGTAGITGSRRLYVERRTIETRACREILKPGALLRIMGSRHMGKTSLINHILAHAQQQGYLIVSLSFYQADLMVNDLRQLLRNLCVFVSRRLNLADKTSDYWNDTSATNSCSDYFEEYLLLNISQPLVLCLDDIDLLFQHTQVANGLLGLLRVCYEAAKTHPVWQNLHLIVSYKGLLPRNGLYGSPLNVGEPIELRELTKDEVSELVRQQGLQLNSDSVAQLMDQIGGHPYLIQKALVYLAERRVSVEQFLKIAHWDSDHYQTHLADLWGDIESDLPLVKEFKRVVHAPQPVRIEEAQIREKLNALGLITFQDGKATLRNNLYCQYFKRVFQK